MEEVSKLFFRWIIAPVMVMMGLVGGYKAYHEATNDQGNADNVRTVSVSDLTANPVEGQVIVTDAVGLVYKAVGISTSNSTLDVKMLYVPLFSKGQSADARSAVAFCTTDVSHLDAFSALLRNQDNARYVAEHTRLLTIEGPFSGTLRKANLDLKLLKDKQGEEFRKSMTATWYVVDSASSPFSAKKRSSSPEERRSERITDFLFSLGCFWGGVILILKCK